MMYSTLSEDTISHVTLNQFSVHIPHSNQASMEDHFDKPSILASTGSTPEDTLDSPPSYDADLSLQSSHTRRKYNIQPREDEGRETLPPYSSEISLENIFSRKVELEGAVHRAADRSWSRVYVALQGTALTFHKYKASGIFAAWTYESGSKDVAVPAYKGHILKSYNLQHADVGIAADYYKKKFVIRVRAETDQFLLSCFKIETFVHWLQSLFAAIDIAPPLDSRSLPRDYSIPRTRRRRGTRSATITDLERNATLVREQYEIMRRQYPSLVEGPFRGGQARSTEIRSVNARRTSTSWSHISPLQSRTSLSSAVRTILSRPDHLDRSLTQSNIAIPVTTHPETHPSISPETGKWRPEHQWSAMYDMVYAKRCMAVLLSRSPRKSDVVIMKGKQWVVNWATGALTRCEPPDYGEVVTEKSGGCDEAWQTAARTL